MNEENFDGHNGFEHEYMEDILKKTGFTNINSKTFFYGKKRYQEKSFHILCFIQ